MQQAQKGHITYFFACLSKIISLYLQLNEVKNDDYKLSDYE